MTKEKFAKLFFKEAKNNSAVLTRNGNIKCPNKKNISIRKLEKIFNMLNKDSCEATSKELKSCGIQPCCFITFKFISNIVLNHKKSGK